MINGPRGSQALPAADLMAWSRLLQVIDVPVPPDGYPLPTTLDFIARVPGSPGSSADMTISTGRESLPSGEGTR